MHIKKFRINNNAVNEALEEYHKLQWLRRGIIALLIVLFFSIIVLVLQPFSQAPLYAVDASIVAISREVPANGVMNVVFRLVNVGRSKEVEVRLQHRVFDMNGVLIASLQENVFLVDVLEKEVSLRIPQDITKGPARVRTGVWYPNGFRAVGAEFEIVLWRERDL